MQVAPYVGAWIETRPAVHPTSPFQSHPTWVRGLKHFAIVFLKFGISRTLRGCVDDCYFGTHVSHPTWVRGLKQ